TTSIVPFSPPPPFCAATEINKSPAYANDGAPAPHMSNVDGAQANCLRPGCTPPASNWSVVNRLACPLESTTYRFPVIPSDTNRSPPYAPKPTGANPMLCTTILENGAK